MLNGDGWPEKPDTPVMRRYNGGGRKSGQYLSWRNGEPPIGKKLAARHLAEYRRMTKSSNNRA